jgi:TPR repeat protein
LKKSITLTILICLVIVLLYALSGRTYGWGRNALNVQNFNTAKFWFYIAAHQGDGRAQNNLAGFYAEGRGGKKSAMVAVYWYKKMHPGE